MDKIVSEQNLKDFKEVLDNSYAKSINGKKISDKTGNIDILPEDINFDNNNTIKQIITTLNTKVANLETKVSDMESIPIGSILFGYSQPSSNWIKLQGQEVLREDYPKLFSYAEDNNLLVSEEQWNQGYTSNFSYVGLFSKGDESTTFRIPDYRACFIRGLDTGRGIDVYGDTNASGDPEDNKRILGTEQLPTLVSGYANRDTDDDYGWLQVARRFSRDTYTFFDYDHKLTEEEVSAIPARSSEETWGTYFNKYGIMYPGFTTWHNLIDKVSNINSGGPWYALNWRMTNSFAKNWFAATRPRNIALIAYMKSK